MIDFGVDLTDINHDKTSDHIVREKVTGRVAHIDGDFIAHQVSYDEIASLDDMQQAAEYIINKLMDMSGAETYVIHLTPQESNKGLREHQALLKKYQANRENKEKPPFLHVMRHWLHKEHAAILWLDREADDGMATRQYEAILGGNQDKSIIISKDKDLRSVPGLHLDWDTGEITDTGDDPFGWLELDTSGKTKKVKGRGWKFFWCQMLMGDSADNISGLPKVCHQDYIINKPKSCGPVMAYNILDPVKTNVDAFELVRDLYKLYGEEIGFKNYRDYSDITFGQAFMSEARLLWMRRSDNYDDVLNWLSHNTKGSEKHEN